MAGLRRSLAACPGRPSCVSSEEERSQHSIHPFELARQGSFEQLVAWIAEQPGAQLVEAEEGYAHFVFRSRILGFKDDLEVLLRGERVAVRSCSQTGYWDLGVNRRRVEALRKGLCAAGLIR